MIRTNESYLFRNISDRNVIELKININKSDQQQVGFQILSEMIDMLYVLGNYYLLIVNLIENNDYIMEFIQVIS